MSAINDTRIILGALIRYERSFGSRIVGQPRQEFRLNRREGSRRGSLRGVSRRLHPMRLCNDSYFRPGSN
jgi:hypothetical protein